MAFAADVSLPSLLNFISPAGSAALCMGLSKSVEVPALLLFLPARFFFLPLFFLPGLTFFFSVPLFLFEIFPSSSKPSNACSLLPSTSNDIHGKRSSTQPSAI